MSKPKLSKVEKILVGTALVSSVATMAGALDHQISTYDIIPVFTGVASCLGLMMYLPHRLFFEGSKKYKDNSYNSKASD